MPVTKRYERWCLLLMVVVSQLLTVIGIARADDNKGDNKNVCLSADATGCTNGLPTFQYQLLVGEMAAHPTPDVRRLQVDFSELGMMAYYRVYGGIQPLYDAPNGNIVGVVDSGFSYVNVRARQGDWAQLSPTRWIPIRDLTQAASSPFSGVLIEQPLAYPMAWILLPTVPSAIPGAKADPNATMLERYARVNLFATLTVDDEDWFLIGPAQWVPAHRVARVLPVGKPADVKGRWVAVDLYEQVLTAYEDDRMVFATMVATGLPRPQWGTNKGLFRIWARLLADDMAGAFGRPDYYNLKDVPWVMYFDNSIALHGAYWHDNFGYRMSHGCVNMSVTDAHWLYEWTAGFYEDTWVYVYASQPTLKPRA
jgi:L,D-transpeptidase catalytic domain